jgi:hypothetical protein
MKKTITLSIFLIGLFSFGQTPPKKKPQKDIDKEADRVIDSLSKVYKVKIYSIKKERLNGVVTTSIAYGKNGELVYKVIKTEKATKDDE